MQSIYGPGYPDPTLSARYLGWGRQVLKQQQGSKKMERTLRNMSAVLIPSGKFKGKHQSDFCSDRC